MQAQALLVQKKKELDQEKSEEERKREEEREKKRKHKNMLDLMGEQMGMMRVNKEVMEGLVWVWGGVAKRLQVNFMNARPGLKRRSGRK